MEVMTMPEPISTAIIIFALGIWAAGLRMAWEIVVVGRRVHPPGPDVLSGLAQRNRVDFMRHGREAELGEITGQVQHADPAMPEDDPVDLEFEFQNRAN